MIAYVAIGCLSVGVVFGYILCALLSMNGDDDNG